MGGYVACEVYPRGERSPSCACLPTIGWSKAGLDDVSYINRI